MSYRETRVGSVESGRVERGKVPRIEERSRRGIARCVRIGCSKPTAGSFIDGMGTCLLLPVFYV